MRGLRGFASGCLLGGVSKAIFADARLGSCLNRQAKDNLPASSLNWPARRRSVSGFTEQQRLSGSAQRETVFSSTTHKLIASLFFVSQDPDRARNWLLKPENKEKVLTMLGRGRGSSPVLRQGFLTWNISRFFNALSYREFDSGHRFKKKDTSRIAELERTAAREALDGLTQLVASLEKGA
ncbi:MAG: hypothetical protein ACLQJ0_21790 [Steroidobacteraceae bacterium]|jgi:hypothetical protein